MTTPAAPGTDHSGEVGLRLLTEWLDEADDIELTTVTVESVRRKIDRISAALAARRPHTEAEEAVRRVHELLARLDAHPMPDLPAYCARSYADAIRAALAGDPS